LYSRVGIVVVAIVRIGRLKSTRGTETEPTKTIRFLEESIWGPFKGCGEVDFVGLGEGGSEVIGKDFTSQVAIVAQRSGAIYREALGPDS